MADLREQLQSGLADRYRIERELGRGGMATVTIPYFLSPEWLRIDPEWKPLRGTPRFEALLRRSS